MNKDIISRLIKKILDCRNFELECSKWHKAGKVLNPIYLSVGTEHIASIIAFNIEGNEYLRNKGIRVFPQHRCHSYFLSLGGSPLGLARELIGLESGYNQGKSGSASLHIPNLMFGHSGLLGDQVPIAVGYAQAANAPVVCILGDAAAEEDYVLGALGYAITNKCKVFFVVEDNNLSILTKKEVRRSWSIRDVAAGMGIKCYDVPNNFLKAGEHLTWGFECLKNHNCRILMNFNVVRQLWHAGSGIDSENEDVIFSYLKQTYKEFTELEGVSKKEMEQVWNQAISEIP